MCVQHGLKFILNKSVGNCHMPSTCSSITLHAKLYMFSLLMLTIVNKYYVYFVLP